MCDTVLVGTQATADGGVLIAKNSDREPGEAQIVEWHRRRHHDHAEVLPCTWQSIPQASTTWQTVLSRPFWMWGAEMGANEHGLAVANQAVFTRFAVAEQGLTGMDLVRIALERATSASEAIDVIIDHIARFGQGGRCGYRHRNFRYDSAFALADSRQAWVLETAGPFWAARRIGGIWSLSNCLSITTDFERLSDGAEGYARRQGWIDDGQEFSFRKAFAAPAMDWLSGARRRRRCLRRQLESHHGQIGPRHLASALRSHGGQRPDQGLRMSMPCSHASWLPTRSSGQAVGSMIAEPASSNSALWLTGTSSPCLSVFKPAPLTGDPVEFGPPPGGRFDEDSLFWRHERFHRNMAARRFQSNALPPDFADERRQMEDQAFDLSKRDAQSSSRLWERHRRAALRWAKAVEGGSTPRPSPHYLYWRYQDWLDGRHR